MGIDWDKDQTCKDCRHIRQLICGSHCAKQMAVVIPHRTVCWDFEEEPERTIKTLRVNNGKH